MHYWIEVSESQRQRLSRQSAYYASRGSILTMFTWVTFILMFFCIQTRCLTLHMKNTWVFVTLCKARQQKILCRWVMNAYFGLCLCTILLAERKFKAPAVMVCRIAQLVYAYTSLYKQHQLGFNIVRTQNAGVVLDPGFLAVLSSNVSVWAAPPERDIDAAVLQADLYSVLHSSVAGIKPADHGIVALHQPGTWSKTICVNQDTANLEQLPRQHDAKQIHGCISWSLLSTLQHSKESMHDANSERGDEGWNGLDCSKHGMTGSQQLQVQYCSEGHPGRTL